MTSEIILEDLKEIVQKLMHKEGVDNYELVVEGQSENGDNYMGEIIFFNIVSKDNIKLYNLIMKAAKRSEEYRNVVPVEFVFNREIYMYSEIFPTYRKFVNEVDPKFPFDFVPKIYWTCADLKRETLILENLKTRGFTMWNRKKPWSLELSLFVMEHYGKLHALSLALEDQKPELFKELTKNLTSITKEWSKSTDVKKYYQQPIENAMDLFRNAGRHDLVEKYKPFEEDIRYAFNRDTDDPEDKLVICHGDCWNNNFMFKYQNGDTLRPSNMCFLDFQLSLLDSPIIDLSYNIYSTCDKSLLDQFDLLLGTYYTSLSDNYKRLGSNPDDLFTYEQLKQYWGKFGKFGVIISSLIVKLELVDAADAPDIVQIIENAKLTDNGFEVKLDNMDEYNRRMFDVFAHFGDNFL